MACHGKEEWRESDMVLLVTQVLLKAFETFMLTQLSSETSTIGAFSPRSLACVVDAVRT